MHWRCQCYLCRSYSGPPFVWPVPNFRSHYFAAFASIVPASPTMQYLRISLDCSIAMLPVLFARFVPVHADRYEQVSICVVCVFFFGFIYRYKSVHWNVIFVCDATLDPMLSHKQRTHQDTVHVKLTCNQNNDSEITCKNESLLFADITETWSESNAMFDFFELKLGKQHRPLYEKWNIDFFVLVVKVDWGWMKGVVFGVHFGGSLWLLRKLHAERV